MKAFIAALTLPVLAFVGPGAARAADFGGDCCADLEERIAELEATTARKGNRKVSLTVAGQVNKTILFWDDENERNAYIVGNKNDQTNISFTGEAKFAPSWTAGYDLTLRLRDDLSDDVDQDIDNGSGDTFQLWQSHWWIQSESYGKLSVGLASRVTDTAPENDLSETGVAGYAGVQDIGGAFGLRTSGGGTVDLAWGDLGNHFNGDTANLVRYDTPEFAGFIASASWGEDDIWDVGIKYEGDVAGLKVAGTIAYTEINDTDGVFADVEQSTVVGSLAILHEPSGLNALVAAGHREFDETALDADGVDRTPEDAKFIYGKLGWLAKLNALGPTGFYGEYGWFKDYVTVGEFGDLGGVVEQLGGVAGTDRITGSEMKVWGLGVVQHIEAAEMQLYLGYRLHEAEFDLVDGGGDAVDPNSLDDFHTFITGAKIAF
ncbi:MAG: hypothetical protein ACKVP4_14005 [Hyphomicrobium sp.]